MRNVARALVVLLFCASIAFAGDRGRQRQITSGGVTREWLEFAPASLKGAPVVLVLHGHGGSAEQAAGFKRLFPTALAEYKKLSREGVIVLYAQGLVGHDQKTGWHDCRVDSKGIEANDLAFLTSLVQTYIMQGADPDRVFVVGMSNGGFMAHRLAAEMTNPKPRAIAAFSASLPGPGSPCPAPHPGISALIVNGTADPLVPFEGGSVGRARAQRGVALGFQKTVQAYADVNHLGDFFARTRPQTLPHSGERGDNTHIIERTLTGNGVTVQALEIDGGGHVEPSKADRSHPAYLRIVGAQNSDIESADYTWQFFQSVSK